MSISLDNPLFIIPFSTGLVFLLVGLIMLKFPPKKINGLYGYRTTSSMKNQKRWDFSQKFSAIELIKLGSVLALTSIIGLIYNPDGNLGMLLGLGLMIFMVVLLIIRVEKAIKNKFKKEE